MKGKKFSEEVIFKILKEYESGIPAKEVKRLGNTLKYWRQEVLNYFRKRLTNARLEGFNNKASLVRRRAYGYKNPNNYRLRLLSVCG